ncbi:MAG: arginine deiminase family protein [Pseudomonadota bacterium]
MTLRVPGWSYTFTHAIVRAPSGAVVDGLRAVDTGAPDLPAFMRDHAAYVAALHATGAQVTELAPLEAFADAVFVEDTALCLPEGAIAMRPGAPSRAGEVAHMIPALQGLYTDVRVLPSGFIEGGDILVTEREILVGTSARTDAAGVDALTRSVRDWGYQVRTVVTPPDVLHFKTDCGLLDGETVLATERLARSECFAGYRVIHTAPGEEASANAVRFNDCVLFPRGFPRTADRLADAGFNVVEIGNAEAAKVDGGMSCLSLRFSPR